MHKKLLDTTSFVFFPTKQPCHPKSLSKRERYHPRYVKQKKKIVIQSCPCIVKANNHPFLEGNPKSIFFPILPPKPKEKKKLL